MNEWRGLVLLLALLFAAACDNETARTADRAASADTPAAPAAEAGKCEHGLPPGLCTKCNPALAAVFQSKGDWCDEHGFPESFCPICNPNAVIPDVGPTAAPADWCGGHGLPESKCTKCNPELIPSFQAAGDWCNEHGFPESACPICNPQTAPAGAEEAEIERSIVRFRSPKIESAAGIQTVTARSVDAVESAVECTARLAFHGDRVAEVHAIVPGVVRGVRVEIGDRVEPGDALFELESTRVGEIQGQLQEAREHLRVAQANVDRKREALASGITAPRQVELAEQELVSAQAEVSSARAALRMVGAAKASPSGRYTLTAPLAGTVIRRPAVLGILATEDISLATIGDTSVMWVLCDVPESSAAKVTLGQTIELTVDGDSESRYEGEITWIAAEVDPRTRTVTTHAEVTNEAGKLRANQFGRARIEASVPANAVEVPRAAVQRVGERYVVFVRTAPGVYEPRVVKRHGGDEMVRVDGRLKDGDAVVTTGAVLLRTEIMPGSIGAGCCEVEAPSESGGGH